MLTGCGIPAMQLAGGCNFAMMEFKLKYWVCKGARGVQGVCLGLLWSLARATEPSNQSRVVLRRMKTFSKGFASTAATVWILLISRRGAVSQEVLCGRR